MLTPDFGGSEYSDAVTIQPDGRILLAGSSTLAPDPSDMLVARLNTQGRLDTSFGPGAG